MKISKTIKRLRNEKGMTQEMLAEKLFISRQSVSSWENDRTQPDIEMLGKLSEIFDVSVEELIYGQKRNVTLETQKPNYNSTLMIVFSILGSLLAGIGVVLIFVTFWQKMPMFFKAVLSFLPLIAGQTAGVYVLFKKREKLPWCEGAGILWTAGIAATLTMIYNIFNFEIYWYTVLIIISLCIIPVILLLNSVAPIVVFYSCAITWMCTSFIKETAFEMLLFVAVLLAGGCVFTSRLVKSESKSIRSLYAHWVSVAAALVFAICIGYLFGNFSFVLSFTGTLGICLLILSLKDSDITMPYRLPGLAATSVMLFANSITVYDGVELNGKNIIFTVIPYIAILFFGLYIVCTKTKGKDKFFNSYIAICILSLVVFSIAFLCFYSVPGVYPETDGNYMNLVIMKIIAFIANILLMVSGGRKKKLVSINLGFTSIAAITLVFLVQSELSMIINGFLLLIFGGVLLAINFKLSRQNAKKDVPVVIVEEVADNDTEN